MEQPEAAHHPPTLGAMIRRQREFAELPMRQLAAMAGILLLVMGSKSNLQAS